MSRSVHVRNVISTAMIPEASSKYASFKQRSCFYNSFCPPLFCNNEGKITLFAPFLTIFFVYFKFFFMCIFLSSYCITNGIGRSPMMQWWLHWQPVNLQTPVHLSKLSSHSRFHIATHIRPQRLRTYIYLKNKKKSPKFSLTILSRKNI